VSHQSSFDTPALALGWPTPDVLDRRQALDHLAALNDHLGGLSGGQVRDHLEVKPT